MSNEEKKVQKLVEVNDLKQYFPVKAGWGKSIP